MRILYISYDGITDHIGRSQVATYLIGLSRLGYRITVVSAEKRGREKLVAEYGTTFRDSQIDWRYVNYRNKPPLLAQAVTLLLLYQLASSVLAGGSFGIVHCRDLLPTAIGYRLKRRFGVKLLYDFRNFTADGGLERRSFPFVYRYLKRRERVYVRSADRIVCLTERAAEVLTDRYLQDRPDSKALFQVIPCCADFSHFVPLRRSADAVRRARQFANIGPGGPVLLYLGSLGPDYLLDKMLLLFRQLLKLRPEAQFLFLTNNGRDLVEEQCRRSGIDLTRIRFVSADRADVPAYISLADLSVVFIRASPSKAGCSPTKLAELFACDVPVIANAGVGDLDRIVSPHRNGSVVVEDFEEETLMSAVLQVLDQRATRPVNIRENSRKFDLDVGVDRYAAVYTQLLGNAPRPLAEPKTTLAA